MPILKIIENPAKQYWPALLARPVLPSGNLETSVRKILDDVKSRGDQAVADYSLQFDQVNILNRLVQEQEFGEAEKKLDENLKKAIRHARQNIIKFHSNQLIQEPVVEMEKGIRCWRKPVPIEKVGLYIPGGSAPLFSTLLMLGVPAVLAGCDEIVICSPPQKDGSLHPAILYAAQLTGICKVFKVGGVQAIAAMAYGTDTIPQVFKIFGRGNQYVTQAKIIIQQEGIAIDMLAGFGKLVNRQ